MKRLYIIIIVALALLLTGCITERKCLKRYPPEIKETITIETETVTIRRDTTIYITLPGEVQYQTDTVIIGAGGVINTKPSILKTSLAWSCAKIVNNRLMHELHQTDTTIEARLADAIRETERLRRERREVVTVREVPAKLNTFQRIAVVWLWVTLGAFGAGIALAFWGFFKK